MTGITATAGGSIKLGDLVRLMERDAVDSRNTDDNERAWKPLPGKFNPHSKAFFQNCCHCAGGKCERCRAPDCESRDWRERGEDAP